MPLTKKEFAEMAEKLSKIYFIPKDGKVREKEIEKWANQIVAILIQYREKDKDETPPVPEKL